MASNTSLEALNRILFEAMEGVKNQNDPRADACEKMSLEQAKVIADLANPIINIRKTQLQACAIASKIGVRDINHFVEALGVTEGDVTKAIEG